MKKVLLAVCLMSLAAVPTRAFDFPDVAPEDAKSLVLESGESGGIDWTHGFIYARGEGVPMAGLQHKGQARLAAQRAAKVDAQRNLLEIVQGVRIEGETTVENFMLKSDVVKSSVQGVLRGAEIVRNPKNPDEEYTYLSDGTVRVTIRVPLNGFGGLSDVLIPSGVPSETAKKGDDKKKKEGSGEGVFTGLVVDATGLKVKPALRPRVVDEEGQEVYGTGTVERDFAIRNGVVGYLKDVEKAKAHDRVTNNARVVKALRPEGPARTDVVLSQEDADDIRKQAKKMSFLDQCRVIFVID